MQEVRRVGFPTPPSSSNPCKKNTGDYHDKMTFRSGLEISCSLMFPLSWTMPHIILGDVKRSQLKGFVLHASIVSLKRCRDLDARLRKLVKQILHLPHRTISGFLYLYSYILL